MGQIIKDIFLLYGLAMVKLSEFTRSGAIFRKNKSNELKKIITKTIRKSIKNFASQWLVNYDYGHSYNASKDQTMYHFKFNFITYTYSYYH